GIRKLPAQYHQPRLCGDQEGLVMTSIMQELGGDTCQIACGGAAQPHGALALCTAGGMLGNGFSNVGLMGELKEKCMDFNAAAHSMSVNKDGEVKLAGIVPAP